MADLEAEVIAVFERALGVALGRGGQAHSWAFERVVRGEITIADVGKVAEWWSSTPRDGRGHLRSCFGKSEWPRVSALALGRLEAANSRGKEGISLAANQREEVLRSSGQRVWDPDRRMHITPGVRDRPPSPPVVLHEYKASDWIEDEAVG